MESVLTISTPRKYRLGRTTWRSRGGANRGQCDGFSMGQEERANSECLVAICHLPVTLSISEDTITSRYNRRFSLFMPLAISCRISNTQSDSS